MDGFEAGSDMIWFAFKIILYYRQYQFGGRGQGSGEMEVGRPIKMQLQWQQRLNIDVLVPNQLE